MADIFVSYARQDRDWVRQLAVAMGGAGWSVWWDPKIPAGKTFRQVIEAELAAARCVVVVWSAQALSSDWVIEEATEGKDRGILVPVLKERVRPPLGFRQLHCADLSEWAGAPEDARFQQLVQDIAGILGPPAADRERSERGAGMRPSPVEPEAAKARQQPDSNERRSSETPLLPVPALVRVPAGTFRMGTSDEDVKRLCQTTKWAADFKGQGFFMREQPAHSVGLDDYQIGKYPVTNAEYAAFVKAESRPAPRHWSGGSVPAEVAAHPVVNVTWDDTVAYCRWLTAVLRQAGRLREQEAIRLPTEAEWEKAARGTDGRWWPWGNEWSAAKCNSAESDIGATTPVGRYSPDGDSPYGVTDMAGNVWEWCADWYAEGYYHQSPDKNPSGPERGEGRVLRGGSWSSGAGYARGTCRNGFHPVSRNASLGFRVVSSPLRAALPLDPLA